MADIICHRCGQANVASNISCIGCGKSLFGATTKEIKRGSERLSEDEENYVYSNIEYYEPVFHKLYRNRSIASWNWASAFLSPWWFYYRKMYGWGIAATGILILMFAVRSIGVTIGFLIYKIVFGILGNYLYMLHVDKGVKAGRRLSDQKKVLFMKKHGGSSLPLAVLSFLITCGLSALVIWLAIIL